MRRLALCVVFAFALQSTASAALTVTAAYTQAQVETPAGQIVQNQVTTLAGGTVSASLGGFSSETTSTYTASGNSATFTVDFYTSRPAAFNGYGYNGYAYGSGSVYFEITETSTLTYSAIVPVGQYVYGTAYYYDPYAWYTPYQTTYVTFQNGDPSYSIELPPGAYSWTSYVSNGAYSPDNGATWDGSSGTLTITPLVAEAETAPEPAALMMWGISALGCAIGAYRRRRVA